MGDRFAGVFLVRDLGGSGYTDYIFDGDGEPVAGYIVLDAEVLMKRTANAWATWKESTPFRPSAAFKIRAEIARGSEDDRKNAIQYILLHELGHVLSIRAGVHPPWGFEPRETRDDESYPFFSESWRIDRDRNKFVSRFDESIFPERPKVVYYFGATLEGERMAEVYRQLERTDFATLYAATNPGDDWAEAFVTYVHGVLMQKPFRIVIEKDGKVEKTFILCWGTPRCARKERILRELLK